MKNVISNLFSGIFSSSAKTFVGIDIGSSYIKVTQLKLHNGRIVLETYGEVALGPYEDRDAGELTNLSADKLISALNNLLKHANVNARDAVISISSATSLIFILRLPGVSKRDLPNVIPNEARKYIPIPLTEVSLDWWVIPEQEVYGEDEENQNDKKDLSILVAAVRNEIVEKYNTVLQNITNVKSAVFEIETFSAIRGSFKHELSPVLLVDSGASGTRISIIEHGVIRKFHVINRGSAYLSSSIAKSLEVPFKEAEALKREVGMDEAHPNSQVRDIITTGMNYIFSEIQNVILGYERDYQKPISKIMMIGGGSQLKNYKEEMASRLNINTYFADPFDKAVSPDFLEEVLDKSGPEFAISVGLSLQGLQ